ncbi:hypothetical protein ALQ94_101900 [Pseudomonas amygdali pv. morsprunorum]|uniref:Uncharacterized protein n=3 Tax=Pseudomonas syringae group genomosp. 2 TaxID=251698 RepID=A0A3M2WJN6_PSEA0|nr:hypothetical protein ALQ94_101900 [Pseudomonas amygdali pv. morsprunorum]
MIIASRTLTLSEFPPGLVKDYEDRAWIAEQLGTVEAQAFLMVDRGDEGFRSFLLLYQIPHCEAEN